MSTVPTVKAKLVEILIPALPVTQVIYGPLTSVTTTGPRCLTVEGAAGRRDLGKMSGTETTERYTVTLVSSVAIPGTSQQDAEEMALADYAAAELAIREHVAGPSLGLGDGIQVLPTGEFELVERPDETARRAEVRFAVDVLAQNT